MSGPEKDWQGLGVGLTGTGWVGGVHAQALNAIGARLVGIVSRTEERGQAFAKEHGVASVYTDYRALLDDPAVDVVCVGLPNHLHAPLVLDAAAAGKHVICEKPLGVNLEECEAMIAACEKAGVLLGLACELPYTPKFHRAKEIYESGALGELYGLRQREAHGGPHSAWFFTRDEAGGGIMMDMGCHSISITQYVLGDRKPLAVYARAQNIMHPKSELEDHVIALVEYEGGITAQLEPSWALQGGMESHLDLMGTGGVLYSDLLRGTGMRMFSHEGMPADPDETRGWSIQDPDWLWNNGYPQEMKDFLECAVSGRRPRMGGPEGLQQMELTYAAYESAATGRRVELPFAPRGVERAVDLWLRPRG